MEQKLIFSKNGVDIIDGIDLRNGKGLPGGWSTYEVWLKELGGECEIEHQIADIYCGSPKNLAEGISFRIEGDLS